MRAPLVLPPALLPGDTVGVFAPSAPSHAKYPEKYRHGLDQLRRLGYRVKEGSLTARGTMEGYRSGAPLERAAELMELSRWTAGSSSSRRWRRRCPGSSATGVTSSASASSTGSRG
ncbi:LD-carboxypeptidase [Vulgatibacter sp.]|uniref:LD-carboxypeptidase n=1 Tax=Vulgatibacter sp. TaxID=1971226 RepID=UPI00356466AE